MIIVGLEIAVLVFFLIPRTRPLSLALLVGFFAGLVAPLRIDIIGEIGLVACVGIASICPSVVRIFRRNQVAEPARAIGPFEQVAYWYWPAHLAFFWTLTIALYLFPKIETPSRAPASFVDKFPQRVIGRLKSFDRFTTASNVWSVFVGDQLRGTQAYRVRFRLDDGSVVEGARIFEEDGGGGPLSAGFMTTRWPQLPMYFFMGLAAWARQGMTPQQFNEVWQARTLGVVRFCASYLPESSRKQCVTRSSRRFPWVPARAKATSGARCCTTTRAAASSTSGT